tara:strand:+ start:3054 stop:5018 length:1965 start_codon:yes stop_codon:yes gene_type:complete
MKASEYGENLLSGIREINAKKQRKAESRAKSNAWKAFGIKTAIGMGNSIMEGRQKEFLTNETNLANKLKVGNATDLATRYTAAESASQDFAGGREAYFQGLADPEVKNYLENQFEAGTYSQTEYDAYAKQLRTGWGKKLQEQHDGGLKATNDFLADTGGDKDAYMKAASNSKATTLSGGIANFIGNKTGMLKTDLVNSTADMLSTAEELTTFKSTYKKTGDVSLAAFVATEGLEKGEGELGNKAATYSEIKTRPGTFGEEVSYIIQTNYDAKGNVSGIQEIFADATTGKFNFNTAQTSKVSSNFDLLISSVGTDDRWKGVGGKALTDMDREQYEELTEYVKDKVGENYKSTSTVGGKMILAEGEILGNIAGAIVYTGTTEKWATATQSKYIAQEMLLADMRNPGSRSLNGAGFSNPYHTMFAVEAAVKNGKMNTGDSIADLGTKSLGGLYNAYRTETSTGRDEIDARLEANNFFGEDAGIEFAKFHKTVQAVVADKTMTGTDANLEAMYNKLYPTLLKPPVDMGEDTGVMDGAIPPQGTSVSALQAPPVKTSGRSPQTTSGKAAVKQRREYKLLGKYAERVAFLEKNIDAPVQYGIDNAKKLLSAKKMMESSYNAYAEKYGYTLGQDELADLTDDEKTLYFSTGKRPGRHTPAK